MDLKDSARVLIASQDQTVAKDLSRPLVQEGFVTEIVETGERALEMIWKNSLGFLLLDLDLPGMSGLDVLRIVRQDPRSRKLPVIALSDNSDRARILTAFNLNADDFIATPFHPEELIARVRAVLSRKNQVKYEKDEVLTKGRIRIHLAVHRVTCDGNPVNLTHYEYELLLLFMRKEGRVLSREYLLEHVWDLSKDVTTRTVDMAVSRLRTKLNGEGKKWIETVPSYGYRFRSV